MVILITLTSIDFLKFEINNHDCCKIAWRFIDGAGVDVPSP